MRNECTNLIRDRLTKNGSHWLKINFQSQGLTHLLLEDNFQSSWLKAVLNKLQVMGFSPQTILSMQWDEAKSTLKQRIMDMKRQAVLSRYPNVRVIEMHKYCPLPMAYLSQLKTYKFRKAFTLARCEAFPSVVLEGRFKIPREQRLWM